MQSSRSRYWRLPLAALSPQVSYPSPAIHGFRGALATQAVFEIAPPDVDVARTHATFRALSFVFVAVHHRRKPIPEFVDYTRFRRTGKAHRAVPLWATERTRPNS